MLNSLVLMAGFFTSAMTPSELAEAHKTCTEMGGFLDAVKGERNEYGPVYMAKCYLPNDSIIRYQAKEDEVKQKAIDCALRSANRSVNSDGVVVCTPKQPKRFLDQLK